MCSMHRKISITYMLKIELRLDFLEKTEEKIAAAVAASIILYDRHSVIDAST